MPGMSAPLQGGFQQPTRATEHTALDIPASTNWGAKSVSDVQTDGLAGLLAGKGQEDSKSALPPGMSGTAASTADALSLQFGQFDMRNAGMGDFGAGFGSGFGDELGVGDAQAHTPINSNHTTKAPEPDAQKDSSGFSPAPEPVAPYQPTQGYSYSQPPSAAIATLVCYCFLNLHSSESQ